jgi:GNAT superfamily N-acetyltransferase
MQANFIIFDRKIRDMIELRAAQLSDAADIASLHAKSWQQTYRGIFSDHFLDNEVEDERAQVWHQRLAFPDARQRVLVAEVDGKLVGFACILIDDDPTFGTLLDNLHVADGYRNTGVGKQLMQRAASYITKEARNLKMYLWVYVKNTNAVKIYDYLGGKNAETVEKDNEDGKTAAAHRYVWQDVSVLTSR